jgi:hypothetical protein
MGKTDSDQYSEQEAQQRFEKLVRSALNTKPTPLKDVPKKWSGVQRGRKRTAAKTGQKKQA